MERILMSKLLKAIAIFLGMVALPILADNLLNKRPDIRLFRSFEWPWHLTLVLILVIAAIAVFAVYDMIWGPNGILKKFEDDIGQIQGWVKFAERELLGILRAWDQTGRVNITRERAEWAAMANPSIFPTIFHILKDDIPPKGDRLKDANLVAVAEHPENWSPLARPLLPPPLPATAPPGAPPEAFGALAQQAFDMNKTDMANRGTAMGNATLTAILLREVYGGNYGRPKIKLSAMLADGKIPFVAPGLEQLFGFGIEEKTVDGKTEKKLIWDPPHDSVKLSMAMEQGGFPNALFLVDQGNTLSGWLTIWKLTQQAPPPGWTPPPPPRKPPPSRWRLYLEYRRTCWEDAVTPK
jgi:hypothetical protein